MIDIEKTIKELGLELYKEGGDENVYWCPLCGDHPNHSHAHLSINQNDGRWYCFYCGRGHYNLKVLCDMLHKKPVVADEAYKRRKHIGGKKRKKKSTLSDRAIRIYFDTLEEKDFRDFEKETLKKFGVRYDPDIDSYIILLRDENDEAIGYSLKKDNYYHRPDGVPVGSILFGLSLVENEGFKVNEEEPSLNMETLVGSLKDRDYSVHFSNIEGDGDGSDGFKTINPGLRVTFCAACGSQGRNKAVNVRVIRN
jgi:cold shock CspA family protein